MAAQPRWTLTRHWRGDIPKPGKAADRYRKLVSRWLRSFGPGTEGDLVWGWGSTKSAVRTAPAEVAAVQVSLDGGTHGWLLANDIDEAQDPGLWVALLPSLDPLVMGWQSRILYTGSHREQLFDSQGNAGTTIWVDGRVIGYMVQDGAGAVHLCLLERVLACAKCELQSEAKRLAE